VRARSRARGWALQILYAWEARGGGADALWPIIREFFGERRVAPESRQYIERLAETVGEHMAEIDDAVQGALTNWRIERLSVVDRNILRLAAAEMMYMDEVPPRVSIQEAVVLAEKYGTGDSPRFVNGVLDALMRAVGGGGRTGAEGGER
jgi:N utilization substance protein B